MALFSVRRSWDRNDTPKSSSRVALRAHGSRIGSLSAPPREVDSMGRSGHLLRRRCSRQSDLRQHSLLPFRNDGSVGWLRACQPRSPRVSISANRVSFDENARRSPRANTGTGCSFPNSLITQSPDQKDGVHVKRILHVLKQNAHYGASEKNAKQGGR